MTQVRKDVASLHENMGRKDGLSFIDNNQPFLSYGQDDSWASQVAPVVKNLPATAGDIRDEGLIPGSGRSPGGGYGNPLQYSCLENPMDRGAWQATIHRVTQSCT